VWGTIRKIGSLQLISIEKVHPPLDVQEGDCAKVSAEVKVKVNFEVLQYSTPIPEQLRVGVEVEPTTQSATIVTPRLVQMSREIVGVVEANAMKTKSGFSDVEFTAAYPKRDEFMLGKMFSMTP
jgi:hypothetical protein